MYGAYNCKQGVFKHNYVKVNIDANIKNNKFEKVRAYFNVMFNYILDWSIEVEVWSI